MKKIALHHWPFKVNIMYAVQIMLYNTVSHIISQKA